MLTLILTLFETVTAENDDVTLEFFYSETCPKCNLIKPKINDIEDEYQGIITVNRYLIGDNTTSENRSLWKDYYGFQFIPAIVIFNQTNQTKFKQTCYGCC